MMPKCPNCGNTATTEWIDSLDKPDTHSFYFCRCGECFVAENPNKKKQADISGLMREPWENGN